MRAAAGVWLVLCCGIAHAQPFSRVDVGAGLTANVYAPDLQPWWANGFGGDASVRTPFYRGILEAGGSIHHYSARRATVPDFTSLFAFAGWGMRSESTGFLHVYGGGRLGIYMMIFDEDPRSRKRSAYESEMALAPVVALEWPIRGGWSVFTEAQHVFVLTAVRLHLTYVTIGARRSLAAPEWLRTFLE